MEHWSWLTESGAVTMLSLAVILLAGFAMTRLTRLLRLPNVTGYICAGVLIGPQVLNLLPADRIASMDFVTDLALALIAFDVGRFFTVEKLRAQGMRMIVLTLAEALAGGALVTLAMYFLFGLPLSFSLLLGAVGCATAPASTMMTIRQYHAKGTFVDTILQVVALDDAVALIAFSVCAAIVASLGNSGERAITLIGPAIALNLGVLALGWGLGWLLSRLITDTRSNDHRLILALTELLILTGLCAQVQVSPLLACMVMGATYMHSKKDRKLFKQVNRFAPPIKLLFFVLSGMRLDLASLPAVGIIGVVYFFVRILGKYLGAWVGGKLIHADASICRYLGLALIPQAGVSIGLAALGQRILPAESGALLTTIILSSAVLYEIVGPACAKLSLRLAGVIHSEAKPTVPEQKAS